MDNPLGFLAALRRHAAPVRLPAAPLAPPAIRPPADDPVNAFVARFEPEGKGRFDIALKDIFAIGSHVPAGGTSLPIDRPDREGTVVRRLREAGARIVGVLNQDELAAGGSGANRRHGRCLNPWDPTRLTGGSSGGSAAAVAAGLVPHAIGSDAGGSIRIPAAWCGVTGHKPSFGLVGRSGALARGWGVDCIGPFARDALACATILACIAGPDADDPASWALPELRGDPPARFRIRRPAFPDGAADEATVAGIEAAAAAFAAAGHEVTAGPPADYAALGRAHQILVRAEAAALHGAVLDARPGIADPGVEALILSGRDISAIAYLETAARRAAHLETCLDQVFGTADLLLLPVAPTPAPPASGSRDRAVRMHDDALFTRFVNHLGLPATAFPTGLSPEGLPLAAQLVGRPFADGVCLAAVAAFQSVTTHHDNRPPLWVSD